MKNSNGQFTVLAEYYDMLNGADFKGYAEFITSEMKKNNLPDACLMLELGCGTGSLTLELAERGYDMIGADISYDMLNVAMCRASEKGKSVLYLLQDMCSFELYGTVGGIVCANDGINYLASDDDVVKCMRLVRNYLDPGGLFIFDVNTPYRFREVFAKHDFFTEDGEGNVYMGWKSELDEKNGSCDFYITLFVKKEDGSYEKAEEQQTEYIRDTDRLKKCISDAGLELISVYSDMNMTVSSGADGEEKLYFVCRCPPDDK